MKKVLSIVAMLLVVALIGAGCSGNSNDTAKTKEKSEGPVEVVMWQHGTSEHENAFYVERIKEFNEAHEGKIHVDMKVISRGAGNDFENKLNMAAAAGELPDIIDMDGPYVANYAQSGIIGSIDKYFTKEEKNEYAPSIIQQGTWDGKLYALGAMESSVAIYYNTDMLASIGVEVPQKVEDAWTMEEFYNVLKKLKAKYPDVYPIAGLGGDMNEWLTYMGTPFIWSNDGDIISKDGMQAERYMNSEKTIESMKFIQKIFDEGLAVNDPGEQAFERQKAAMTISGPWELITIKDYPGLKWGMTPMPVFKKGQGASPTGSWAWGMQSETKHPKEAVEVIKWMTNTDSTVGLSKVTGMPPSRKDAYEQLPVYSEYPVKLIMEQQLQTGHARPVTPAYPILTQEFAKAWYNIIHGKNVEKALNEATKKVDRYIERRIK